MNVLNISCAQDVMCTPQYAGILTELFSDQPVQLESHKNNSSCEGPIGAVNHGEVEAGVNSVIVARSNQQTCEALAQRANCPCDLQWLKWLQGETAETVTVTKAVASSFPGFSPERLPAVVKLRHSSDLWAASSALQLDQVQRWSEALELSVLIMPGRLLGAYLDVL